MKTGLFLWVVLFSTQAGTAQPRTEKEICDTLHTDLYYSLRNQVQMFHHSPQQASDTLLHCNRPDTACLFLKAYPNGFKGILYSTDSAENVTGITALDPSLKIRYQATFYPHGKIRWIHYLHRTGLYYEISYYDHGGMQALHTRREPEQLRCQSHKGFLGDKGEAGISILFYANGQVKQYDLFERPDLKYTRIRYYENGRYMEKLLGKGENVRGRQYYANGKLRSKAVRRGKKTRMYKRDWMNSYQGEEQP